MFPRKRLCAGVFREIFMKVVIIGGVAGGATAAARIRRLDERAEIVMLERTGYVSYANCGLPYYVGGTIGEEDALTLQTPQSFFARYRVDVRVGHEAVKIDRAGRRVTVRDLATGRTYEESYDKLLLAPGAKPVLPAAAQTADPRVFTLRTVEDTLALHDFVAGNKPRTAVVVGGGFIGLETAENLVRRGVHVTLIQRGDHVLAPLDRDMACFLHAELIARGVDLRLNTPFEGLRAEKQLTVCTKNGEINADLAVIALGVTPDTQLAKEAGLELGMKESIVTDAHMRTSDPDIYAAGDAVEVRHFVTGAKTLIALAGPANKQGRIAADNICGIPSEYRGSQGSSVIQVFSRTAANTGLNEKAARAAGLDYDKVILSPANHATYYPGAQLMTMKVLFERGTRRILGAQIVGGAGTDKRIDVLATAIRAGMTADELKDLDLAYAPPYSSAKDPVNMAGYMIDNVLSGRVKQFFYEDLAALPKDGSVLLLDTRTRGEYARGHADGFFNLPLDELRERLSELDRGRKVYVMCQSGLRSYLACRILAQNGFDCFNFAGGYRYYAAVHA